MKPIIVDMKDMSDSTEVYESKPNKFLVYTIYAIFLMLVIALIWMKLSKIEVVVKSNGIFKGSSNIYEISSAVTGSVKESNVTDGQYVEEGDILYTVGIDELSDTIVRYQDEMAAAKDRIDILSAYEKSLDSDESEMDLLTENPYYDEFVNRRDLLFASLNLEKTDKGGQSALYKGNIDSISGSIDEYKDKIEKLKKVKQCISERNNSLAAGDSYYSSMVDNYLASYSYTASQYDNQIDAYQKQIEEYEKQIKEGKKANKKAENTSLAAVSENTILPNYQKVDIEALEKQKDDLVIAKESAGSEKEKALKSLELQQTTTVEQQISGYEESILSMESNLNSTKLQLNAVNGVDNGARENVAVLTEKGNVAAEILSYENKVKECENYLNSYDIQSDNCIIKANVSGYYYNAGEYKIGSFVQAGTSIGSIYPQEESKYYAEIYVENSDIAKIKEGQEVKFEIAAYPSSEYGYFRGTVDNIAKDIAVDQSTGYAYYLVKVKCDQMTIMDEDGEEISLMNGMACQGKIIVEEKDILTFLLEKIDILD